jgi:hypothetical protein
MVSKNTPTVRSSTDYYSLLILLWQILRRPTGINSIVKMVQEYSKTLILTVVNLAKQKTKIPD